MKAGKRGIFRSPILPRSTVSYRLGKVIHTACVNFGGCRAANGRKSEERKMRKKKIATKDVAKRSIELRR